MSMIVHCLINQNKVFDKDGKEYRISDHMFWLPDELTEAELEEKFPGYVKILSVKPLSAEPEQLAAQSVTRRRGSSHDA